MSSSIRSLVISLALLCLPVAAVTFGQEEDFVHPELNWRTIQTEHFLVHYQDGAERTAQEVAKVAEEIYVPVTSIYQHEPDQKVSFIIRDHDDYSNGAAYFYENRIEIYAPALDFELRGTHPWIRNVVTHEFTHIVQIQTAMKFGRRVPGIYLQWFGYESERRPDVLYGFPNVLVSYPVSGFVVPSWFAEGVAQFNSPTLHYDYWDTHRDMILRMYMLDGNPLSWEEMSVFGKTSLGNESSYNAGFSIVGYIVDRFGLEKLRQISVRLSALPRVTIDGAIQEALGISGAELYEEWKTNTTARYRSEAEAVQGSERSGRIVEEEGFGNSFPCFTPDGTRLLYVSNKGEDYFGQSSVYEFDLRTGTRRKLLEAVRSRLSVSPDGRYLFYAKATRDNPHWSKFYDLYRFDLQSEDEIRLTHGLRARDPQVSSDGRFIVFAFGSGGTMNVGITDSAGGQLRSVTRFRDGEQVYTPSWSPDGATIAFGYSSGHRQCLALADTLGSEIKLLVADADARNPVFSLDGQTLYYACDRSGIFDIYAQDRSTGSNRQITNVIGGAFLPAVNRDGDLAYVLYTSGGYKIALLGHGGGQEKGPIPSDLLAQRTRLQGDLDARAASEYLKQISSPAFLAESAPTVGTEHPLLGSQPYRNTFTSLSLIPVLRVDNYNPRNKGIDIIKPGLYFSSSDVLDKLRLFGGAAINRKLERDLFLNLEYRDRIPLLYQLGLEPALSIELYNISRTTSTSFELYPYRISTDVSYNLLEFDIGLRQNIISEYVTMRLWYTLSRYNAEIGSFINPFTRLVNPSFRNTYLIGHVVNARLHLDGRSPRTETEINPVGRTVTLYYAYEMNRFNPEGRYDVEKGFLVPRYDRFYFHRIELAWNEHVALPLPHQTLSLGLRAGTIPWKKVDSFFDFYVGGFTGMKGYPYYALGGNSVASLNVAYRFPISRSLDARLFQFYFKRLYVSLFGDVGNAWTGAVPALSTWKTDAGMELRLEAFSFYAYPTRIFLSGAYGFDRFTKVFVGTPVTYGQEWHFYLGVLFDFELTDFLRR